ncbi:LytS/YhcK type 5TM receptor domain-containing protein [Escherichia coli]|nr:hypothetical protein [Escherichia coli]
MHEIFNMLLAVFDRAALMLICLFFLIRIRLFRELLHKSAHSPKELLAVTAIFSLFALFSTWSGVPVEGSLVNVRIIAVMSGGILFGPWVGIITGVIAGIHRYLIDIGGVTAIPCFITSILAGCISGWINLKIPKAQRWRVGILGGMLCETLTMILVIVWAPTTALGIDIVSKIGIPMILGSVCIGFIVLLVQSVEGEKEASAARQAKLALDIANKTLPLFRHVNSESLRKVCEIIRDDIHADAVAITNTDHVLAYVGVGEHNYQNGDDFISPTTRQAMNYGKIIIKNNDEAHRTPEIHSMLVIPLWEKGVVTGTLKNAIVHGIQPCKGKGVVTISVAECGNRVRIAVRDTGHGIDPKVIERVEANEMPGNKIGLLNVHHRVKLLYGEGLHIRRLEPGTEIAFYIPNQRTPVASQATLLL